MSDEAKALIRRAIQTLTVPAAEYVPAIPDAWELLQRALDCLATPSLDVDALMRRADEYAAWKAAHATPGNLSHMNAAREALRSALMSNAAPEVQAWQPIETAPKDGTHILACGGHYDAHAGFNQNPPTVVHWFGYPDPGGFYLSHSEGEPMRPFPAKWWLPGAFGATPAAAAQVICSACGVDRLKAPCGQPHNCGMKVDAAIRALADPLQALHDNAQELGAKETP